MRLPPWLGRELDAWQRDGLITGDQRRAILARYAPSPASSELVSRVLVWLAVVAAGVGVVVLLVWNWAEIPAAAKVAVSILGVAAAYWAAFAFSRRGRAVEAERAALVGALLAGAALYIGLETARVDPDTTDVMLVWSVVLGLTAALVPSGLIASVAAAAVLWWMVQAGGMRPAPWGFLLVWPLLAVTAARTGQHVAGSAATLAFGFWGLLAALAVWGGRGVDAPAFVVALLSGAWLDALARAPAVRRPAFARPAPALAVIALSLAFLLPSDAHRGLAGWRTGSADLWPMLALVAALLVSTVRLSVPRDSRRWSRLAIVALCAAWFAAWLLQDGAQERSGFARWGWTLAFSGAAIVAGSAAIRDLPATRDRASFAIGVVLILVTLLVRSVDTGTGGVAAQAAMLIGVAALLYWLARSARRAPEGDA